MASLFITFRYIAFALFIIFSSVVCILAAVNLGALQPHTSSFPQIDVFLIFTGAFALVVIFPVIFTELVRKNAFISRVLVEISWLAILWLMNIAGAAALIALSSEIHCFPSGDQSQMACSSSLALLTFSWLNTILMLAYLLFLVVASVYHAQENHRIWRCGVRDYQWFTTPKTMTPMTPPIPQFLPTAPPVLPPVRTRTTRTTRTTRNKRTSYAQQIGLTKGYRVEPLRIPNLPQIATPPAIDLPPPPAPVAAYLNKVYQYTSRNDDSREDQGITPPTPILLNTPIVPSLYPHHLQSTAAPVNPPRASDDPSPPPAGEWPRRNPQEPLRPKHSKRRPPRGQSRSSADLIAGGSSQQQPDNPASRSLTRLTGPRVISVAPRPRLPPLDIPEN